MGVLLSSKVCPKVKIFDFSADNVHQPDTNDMHTGATLDVGLLPKSFIVCSVFMVGAWTTRSTSAKILTLLDDDGMKQGEIELFAASINTQYTQYTLVFLVKQVRVLFFPLHWIHVCLSLDFIALKFTLVVDVKLSGEGEYTKRYIVWSSDMNLLSGKEFPAVKIKKIGQNESTF